MASYGSLYWVDTFPLLMFGHLTDNLTKAHTMKTLLQYTGNSLLIRLMKFIMSRLKLPQPKVLKGPGAVLQLIDEIAKKDYQRIFLLTTPSCQSVECCSHF